MTGNNNSSVVTFSAPYPNPRSLASRGPPGRLPPHDRLRRRALRGLGGAAGAAHGPGRARGGARADPRRAASADRRRAHRRGRPRLGTGGELRARRRAARGPRPPPERGAAAGDRGDRGRAGARRASTPAATPAREPTATGCSPRRCGTRSSSGGRCGGRSRSTARRSTAARRPLVGTHDFTAFTPTETEHVRFEREVIRAEWRSHRLGGAVSGRAARVLDRGRRLHAPHGPGAGRDDARGRPAAGAGSRTSRRCSSGAPRERAGETAPPHGLYLAVGPLLATRRRSPGSPSSDLAEARGAAGQVDRGAGRQQHRLALGVGHGRRE